MYKGVDGGRRMKAGNRIKTDIKNKEKRGGKNHTKGEMGTHAEEGDEPCRNFFLHY